MPWQEVSTRSLRQEFVTLASQEGANIRALCRRFGISPKTGYKWLQRFQASGSAGLTDRSRRPHRTPTRTPDPIEQQVRALRDQHPAWGGRKLHHRLRQQGMAVVPSPSTITTSLRRHERLDPALTAQHKPWQCFEHARPNDLWQIDFKGPRALGQGRCHALSVLDDHSRFLIGLRACPDMQDPTGRAQLTQLFQRYGLPWRILTDNGPPWGAAGWEAISALEVWLIQLGSAVAHGRPYHPQTQGKVERFHGTLAAELGGDWHYPDRAACQVAFDDWRAVYNLERPHEAVGMTVPARHYQPSPRPFPAVLPPIVYGPEDIVRKVQANGTITYRNRTYRLGKGLRGQPVALRPTPTDGVLAVYFCKAPVGQLDLRVPGSGFEAAARELC